MHFLPGLFPSDFLLSDLFSVLLSVFPTYLVSSASLSDTVALASPTQFVLCSRDRVFSHSSDFLLSDLCSVFLSVFFQ